MPRTSNIGHPQSKDMYWFAHGGVESNNQHSVKAGSPIPADADDESSDSSYQSLKLNQTTRSPEETASRLVASDQHDGTMNTEIHSSIEEKKITILESSQDKNEMSKKQAEREAASEARRNAQRNNVSFAFKTSAPRNFELDIVAAPLSLEERPKPHPTSLYKTSGIHPKAAENVMSQSMTSPTSSVRGRRKNDLTPTVPYDRTLPPRILQPTRKRSVSMSRLDQLAQPRRPYVEAQKANSTMSNTTMSKDATSPSRPLSVASEKSARPNRGPSATPVNRRSNALGPRKPRPVSIAGTIPDRAHSERKATHVRNASASKKETSASAKAQPNVKPTKAAKVDKAPRKSADKVDKTHKVVDKVDKAPHKAVAPSKKTTKTTTPSKSQHTPKQPSSKPSSTKQSPTKLTTKQSMPKTSPSRKQLTNKKQAAILATTGTDQSSAINNEVGKVVANAVKEPASPARSSSPDDNSLSIDEKNANKRIVSEEEAKAALAEKRKLAREQAEREAELERLHQEELRKEAEERARLEEAAQAKMEEEQLKLLEEHRQFEEEKLRKAIEEQERREAEEKNKREEEARLKAELEKKSIEEAEKQMLELEEKLRKEEEERAERKKRLEKIMSRTRGKSGTSSPGSASGSEAQDSSDGQADVIMSEPNSLDSNVGCEQLPPEPMILQQQIPMQHSDNESDLQNVAILESQSLNSNDLMIPSSGNTSLDGGSLQVFTSEQTSLDGSQVTPVMEYHIDSDGLSDIESDTKTIHNEGESIAESVKIRNKRSAELAEFAAGNEDSVQNFGTGDISSELLDDQSENFIRESNVDDVTELRSICESVISKSMGLPKDDENTTGVTTSSLVEQIIDGADDLADEVNPTYSESLIEARNRTEDIDINREQGNSLTMPDPIVQPVSESLVQSKIEVENEEYMNMHIPHPTDTFENEADSQIDHCLENVEHVTAFEHVAENVAAQVSKTVVDEVIKDAEKYTYEMENEEFSQNAEQDDSTMNENLNKGIDEEVVNKADMWATEGVSEQDDRIIEQKADENSEQLIKESIYSTNSEFNDLPSKKDDACELNRTPENTMGALYENSLNQASQLHMDQQVVEQVERDYMKEAPEGFMDHPVAGEFVDQPAHIVESDQVIYIQQKPGDFIEQIPEQFVEKVPKEFLDQTSEQVPEMFGKPASDEFLEQIPENFTKQSSESYMEQIPEDFTKQMVESCVDETPQEFVDQAPDKVAYHAPDEFTEQFERQTQGSFVEQVPYFSKQMVESCVDEVPQEFVEHTPEEFMEQVSEQLTKGAHRGFMEQIPEGFVDEIPEGFVEHQPEEFVKQASERFMEQVPEQLTKYTDGDFVEQMPREFGEYVPEDFLEPAPTEFTKEMPGGFIEQEPEEYRVEASQEFIEGTPKELTVEVSERLVGKESEAYLEHTSESFPGHEMQFKEYVPNEFSEQMPEELTQFTQEVSTELVDKPSDPVNTLSEEFPSRIVDNSTEFIDSTASQVFNSVIDTSEMTVSQPFTQGSGVIIANQDQDSFGITHENAESNLPGTEVMNANDQLPQQAANELSSAAVDQFMLNEKEVVSELIASYSEVPPITDMSMEKITDIETSIPTGKNTDFEGSVQADFISEEQFLHTSVLASKSHDNYVNETFVQHDDYEHDTFEISHDIGHELADYNTEQAELHKSGNEYVHEVHENVLDSTLSDSKIGAASNYPSQVAFESFQSQDSNSVHITSDNTMTLAYHSKEDDVLTMPYGSEIAPFTTNNPSDTLRVSMYQDHSDVHELETKESILNEATETGPEVKFGTREDLSNGDNSKQNITLELSTVTGNHDIPNESETHTEFEVASNIIEGQNVSSVSSADSYLDSHYIHEVPSEYCGENNCSYPTEAFPKLVDGSSELKYDDFQQPAGSIAYAENTADIYDATSSNPLDEKTINLTLLQNENLEFSHDTTNKSPNMAEETAEVSHTSQNFPYLADTVDYNSNEADAFEIQAMMTSSQFIPADYSNKSNDGTFGSDFENSEGRSGLINPFLNVDSDIAYDANENIPNTAEVHHTLEYMQTANTDLNVISETSEIFKQDNLFNPFAHDNVDNKVGDLSIKDSSEQFTKCDISQRLTDNCDILEKNYDANVDVSSCYDSNKKVILEPLSPKSSVILTTSAVMDHAKDLTNPPFVAEAKNFDVRSSYSHIDGQHSHVTEVSNQYFEMEVNGNTSVLEDQVMTTDSTETYSTHLPEMDKDRYLTQALSEATGFHSEYAYSDSLAMDMTEDVLERVQDNVMATAINSEHSSGENKISDKSYLISNESLNEELLLTALSSTMEEAEDSSLDSNLSQVLNVDNAEVVNSDETLKSVRNGRISPVLSQGIQDDKIISGVHPLQNENIAKTNGHSDIINNGSQCGDRFQSVDYNTDQLSALSDDQQSLQAIPDKNVNNISTVGNGNTVDSMDNLNLKVASNPFTETTTCSDFSVNPFQLKEEKTALT